MRKYSLYLAIFSLCLLILSGCGKLDRKGTAPTNAAPKVYFANIPSESTYFSVNPEVYWFGTDIDGFITAYQYGVMVTDSVVSRGGLEGMKSFLYSIPSDSISWVEQTRLMNVTGVHVQAEPGGHKRYVMMYAEMEDTIYTPQYIFLRAVDNCGAVSDSVIHRLFYRNNHRPEAFIDVDSAFRAKNHYCLEETTVTWKGISISWSGLDTADYPELRNQPEFQFKWELVGPFFDSSSTYLDTTAVADSSLDSVFIAGEWIYSRWVSEKMHVFKGLENFGDSGYGWYQLRVRARDDALVSHDMAATLDFRILKPNFRYADKGRKTILIVDATTYKGVDGGAKDTLDVRPFYQAFLSQSGACDEWKIWADPDKDFDKAGKNAPTEDVLSRYDLIIVLNLGSKSGIIEDNYKAYKEYLNIGGRLWLIGLNNFNLGTGRDKPHPLEEIKSSSPNAYKLATEYFGIEEVFVPTWTSADSMTLEFIQAKPFGSWNELHTLEPDTNECKKLKGYNPAKAAANFGVRGIPYVCYVGMSNNLDSEYRIPAQRRIFTFISYYGSVSPVHDKPCALNYIGPTYRTAEFCFPLNLMQNDAGEVFEVMGKMVDEFFWEDLP